ncbi:unnamed protein product, partial [Choristocarpus tenellus]
GGGGVEGREGYDRQEQVTEGGETVENWRKTAAGGRGAAGIGSDLRLDWARLELAQVVEDLVEWKLREGVPGRDVRLHLLQSVCSYLGILSAGGNDMMTEDMAMDLMSVLQGELADLESSLEPAELRLGGGAAAAAAALAAGGENGGVIP